MQTGLYCTVTFLNQLQEISSSSAVQCKAVHDVIKKLFLAPVSMSLECKLLPPFLLPLKDWLQIIIQFSKVKYSIVHTTTKNQKILQFQTIISLSKPLPAFQRNFINPVIQSLALCSAAHCTMHIVHYFAVQSSIHCCTVNFQYKTFNLCNSFKAFFYTITMYVYVICNVV